jgi:predicted GNAT family N-acyltransferase
MTGAKQLSRSTSVEVTLIKTKSDVAASRKIRELVFVVEQEVPAEIEYDEFEDSSIHILAKIDGVPVGTASARGKGVGAALVNFILDQIDDSDVAYLNSQVSAIGFYSKFNFTEVGGIFYEAGIPHRKMIRQR